MPIAIQQYRRVAVVAVTAALLLLQGIPARAATQVGFKAHSFAGFSAESSGGAITGQKPESKLWYHDGKWWAVMLSPTAAGAHRIWRLDPGGWADTGVLVDKRPASKEDVLSVGNTLYIVSRTASTASSNALRRYTYSSGTYILAAGFPVAVPGAGQETITLARDSLGTLWITYEKAGLIYIAHSLGSDTSWGSEFLLPVSGADVNDDDISAIISFTDASGPAIGVMWSNQSVGEDIDYFAVHRDGAADSSWTQEIALTGPDEADDHLSVKTADGRVFAVAKTNKDDGPATLVWLLVRSTTGVWTKHHVATKTEGNTRPITVLNIDPATRLIYVFMTIGEGASATGISYKASSMDAISFPSEATTFIQGASGEVINDATSTKQNTDAASGIVVLASDGANYWWNKLGGGSSTSPPTAANVSATTAEDVPVGITLTGNDSDTCELIFSVSTPPVHGSLGAIANQACTQGSPNTDRGTVTYTPAGDYAGTDSFTFTVHDGTTASSPGTVSLTISSVNDAPTAVAASTSTTQNTPTTVTLNGTDPETCSLIFAITAQPLHGTLGATTDQACSPGAVNADRATVTYTPAAGYTGSDSFAFTVSDGTATSSPATISITIGSVAAGITLRSSSSGANSTSTSLVIPAPSGLSSGDVMLAAISVRGNPTITAPAGWSLVRLDVSTNFTFRQAVYVKATSSEPSSYTWTFSSSQAGAGGIVAYSGVDTAAPVNAHNGQFNSEPHRRGIPAPSVTTTVNGAMIVGFFGIPLNTTIMQPLGMTERFDVASTAGPFFVTLEGSDVLQTSAGATGTKTARAAAEAVSIGQLVALRPA